MTGPESVQRPARAVQAPHRWLTLHVLRRSPGAPLPLPGARVVVRPLGPGEHAGDPVARGTTDAAGRVSLFLPEGRYAVAARHGDAQRGVSLTLRQDGRATLLLDPDVRTSLLTVPVTARDGSPAVNVPVEARHAAREGPAARGITDARGIASLLLPPGEYDVRAGDATARVRLAADATLPLRLEADRQAAAASAHVLRVRAARPYASRFEPETVGGDVWN